MLHAGAAPVTYDQLRALPVPEATATHCPIAHFRLVDMLKHSLTFYGHEVIAENHGLTADGMRYFGLLELKSLYGDYTDTVICRNSNDKKFPVGIGYGGRVFCCDNLSFYADHVIRRKHTIKALRDIHALLAELVEPLALERQRQHQTFEKYKATALTDQTADHAIMELYRQDVLNVQRIPDVISQWDKPAFPEWGDRTAWRLFNAVTFALNGRIAENPNITRTLHNVIDGVCTVQ